MGWCLLYDEYQNIRLKKRKSSDARLFSTKTADRKCPNLLKPLGGTLHYLKSYHNSVGDGNYHETYLLPFQINFNDKSKSN